MLGDVVQDDISYPASPLRVSVRPSDALAAHGTDQNVAATVKIVIWLLLLLLLIYYYYYYLRQVGCFRSGLYVCFCVHIISRNYERTLMEFFEGVGHCPRNERLDFGGDPFLLPIVCPQFFIPNEFSAGQP